MATNQLQAQRIELLTRLPEYGWRLAKIEEDLEWWSDEMWRLESEWRPIGSCVYITFLVDPDFDGSRKKGEAVWAVMASLFKPVNSLQGECEFTFSLGQGWKNNLPAFFAFMGTLRGANQERD